MPMILLRWYTWKSLDETFGKDESYLHAHFYHFSTNCFLLLSIPVGGLLGEGQTILSKIHETIATL